MAKISFSKPYYNVAKEANTVACEEAWNVYFEPMPTGGYAIRRRPGLSLLESSTNTVGYGMYWSDRNRKLFHVQNGNVYLKPGFNSTSTLIGTMEDLGLPAVFAEGQQLDLSSLIYIANGSQVRYITPSDNQLVIPTDPAAPEASFITMMNNRFIANDVNHNQDFLITDVNPGSGLMDATYWSSAVNPFRATMKPDALKGVYSGWNEFYLWGSLACEVWQEDGVTPVSPLMGSIIEAGCISPYSVVMANNTLIGLAYVSGKRAVITINGRTPQVISEPIANILQGYATIEDAVGSLCFVGGLNIYILSFPTEEATWAYDFKTETWSQWSTWDLENAEHTMFDARFGTYAKDWNKHITMSGNGNIYEFSRSEFSDDGNPIRSSIRTGWIDHGTWDRKRSDQLVIKLKGYNPHPSTLLMRWRSDGFPEWSKYMEIRIEANQQNDHFCKLNRMGVYRSRQYEFVMTDISDLALIGMEEDLTKFRN